MTSYLAPIDGEMLVALAWAAPLSGPQLGRLVAPGLSARGVRRHLARLSAAELIAGRICSRMGPQGRPLRVGMVWTLTKAGLAQVPLDRQPPLPAKVRWSLLEHDLLAGDVLSALVGAVRPQLSGLAIEREVRLDPEKARPICDAVITLRWSADGGMGGALPWHTGAGRAEERMTAYAVEVDRSTEPIKTLRDKALAYRRIREDPTWFQRFGKLPLPLWVAPDRERLKAIHAAWVAAWPAGRWYLTTDADLPTLAALAWRDGALGRATLAGTSASGGPQTGTSRSTAP